MGYRETRLRRLSDAPIKRKGAYVLYWCQAARRLERNHALDYAIACSRELKLPLVFLETLGLDGPYTSPRIHRFVLEGMGENAAIAARRGLTYWPLAEQRAGQLVALVERASRPAAVVITDDFPCAPVPEASAALARRIDVPVIAVDSCGIVPLALLGEPAAAAVHFRPRLHRAFVDAWPHRAQKRPRFDVLPTAAPDPPFDLSDPRRVSGALDTLHLAAAVPPVPGVEGGVSPARATLRAFLAKRLRGYVDKRSAPSSPEEGHASALSPYLHHGHISIEEVVEGALCAFREWSLDDLRYENRGKRDGFWGCDPDVESFLDEALTWRDLGYHWHRARHADSAELATALPRWALETLRSHAADPRPYRYSFAEWERAETHDALWNAAERELVATGRMHNYMRMLWGKKVLEWSRSPEEAYATLVLLNNRYALDGCDPNSWTGILWCFGLFDRPWAPNRPVFGSVRYMSSTNTQRKFKLGPYLSYVETLPLPSEILPSGARGTPARKTASPRASTER